MKVGEIWRKKGWLHHIKILEIKAPENFGGFYELKCLFNYGAGKYQCDMKIQCKDKLDFRKKLGSNYFLQKN